MKSSRSQTCTESINFCVCSRVYQGYQWYTSTVQGSTNGTIGNTIGTNDNANGTIGNPNGTIGKPMAQLATNGTIGKITNGTIRRTPNGATMVPGRLGPKPFRTGTPRPGRFGPFFNVGRKSRTPKKNQRVHEVRSVVSREQRILINSFCVQTKLKSEFDRFHHQSQDSRPSWRSSFSAEHFFSFLS